MRRRRATTVLSRESRLRAIALDVALLAALTLILFGVLNFHVEALDPLVAPADAMQRSESTPAR